MEAAKVKLWCHLLEKCRIDFLRYQVLFSSKAQPLGDTTPAEASSQTAEKHCPAYQYAFSFSKLLLFESENWNVLSLAVFPKGDWGRINVLQVS